MVKWELRLKAKLLIYSGWTRGKERIELKIQAVEKAFLHRVSWLIIRDRVWDWNVHSEFRVPPLRLCQRVGTGNWSGCLLDSSLWRCSGFVHLGGDLWADREHICLRWSQGPPGGFGRCGWGETHLWCLINVGDRKQMNGIKHVSNIKDSCSSEM